MSVFRMSLETFKSHLLAVGGFSSRGSRGDILVTCEVNTGILEIKIASKKLNRNDVCYTFESAHETLANYIQAMQ